MDGNNFPYVHKTANMTYIDIIYNVRMVMCSIAVSIKQYQIRSCIAWHRGLTITLPHVKLKVNYMCTSSYCLTRSAM